MIIDQLFTLRENAGTVVNDDWFQNDAFETYKRSSPVAYEQARTAGTIDTLEGPVRYQAGHYIMTGPKGERYPITPEKFQSLYDDNGDGTATPRKIIKLAKLADHDGVLTTSWGDLKYTRGNDYIVRHGPGDYGAVKSDIFARTYHMPQTGMTEAAPAVPQGQDTHDAVQGPFRVTGFDPKTRRVSLANHADIVLDQSIQDQPRPGYNYAFQISGHTANRILLLTADNVITTGKEILLIKRKNQPYAGFWALPGGFIDPGESPAKAARRELAEETGLATTASMKFIGKFDTPGRDPRMTDVWSYAYLAVVSKESVRAGDDASETKWIPIESIGKLNLAFDHAKIIAESGILKPGVAEGRFDEPLTGWHIVYKKSDHVVHGTPSFETKDQAQKYLMTRMFANHQDYKVVHTAGVAEGSYMPHWRVEQSEATGRYYVVTGYTDKSRKVWKNKLGAVDFNKKADAEAKAQELNQGVAEGIMDTLKGAAKEFTRDSLQKKIKQAWENTFWPKHIEPALKRIQIDGQPFHTMVLGEPRVIENDRSKNAILKQYTVNIVFPIDPEQWAGDEIRYLEGQLRNIEDGDWNPKVHGLGLVSFDQPMKSFQYTKGSVPDLVIPVRITSLDINRSLVGEQGVAESNGSYVKHEEPGQWRKAGYERGRFWAQHSGTRETKGFADRETRDQWIRDQNKKGVAEGSSDYFRRREREEAIISGQRPARKKQPAQTSDYAKRRAQEKKPGVAEGSEQQYLWHGSRQKIHMLKPSQSVDTGGAAGSNQNAIYATSDPKVAIAFGLTTPDSDTAMFPNDPQMVLFGGKIRKGKNVYLHKLPFYGPDGKPQFVQGAHDREFYSVPGVKGIKPVEIKAVSVDKYLNLIRQATPADWELRKKNTKEGVAEDKQIDELSPKTLDSYATKAAISNFAKRADMAIAQADHDDSIIAKHIKPRPKFSPEQERKMQRRSEFVGKALNKQRGKKLIDLPDFSDEQERSEFVGLIDLPDLNEQIEEVTGSLVGLGVAQGDVPTPRIPIREYATDLQEVAQQIQLAHDRDSDMTSLIMYMRRRWGTEAHPGHCLVEASQLLNEDLRKWFREKWVRFNPQGRIMGPCARGSEQEGKPKCLPQSKAHALGKKGRASAAARKRRQDPNPERRGAAKNVATRSESVLENTCPHCGGAMVDDAVLAEKQDACYHKVKSRYKVWPSAYASGALVQCRKKGASNWGKKSR